MPDCHLLTSPTTVTFFAVKSMLKEETPTQKIKNKKLKIVYENYVHSWVHFLIIKVFLIDDI